MTDREIKTIDDLLESNLAQQKFLFRMANVKWHRMKEKEAHLDKHQHSREFWQACGRVCSARKLIAAYETLSRLWEKELISNEFSSDLIEKYMKEFEEKTNLGERMRIIRKAAGLKQNEVAEKIGVAPSTYSLYESGDREPNLATIGAIAAALDVSPAYLVGWE